MITATGPIGRWHAKRQEKEKFVKRVAITNAKINVVFKAGQLPQIDPADPQFILDLGTRALSCKISSKAARKLAAHQHGAVLQGRLICDAGGSLVIQEAGFQFMEPKVAQPEPVEVKE